MSRECNAKFEARAHDHTSEKSSSYVSSSSSSSASSFPSALSGARVCCAAEGERATATATGKAGWTGAVAAATASPPNTSDKYTGAEGSCSFSSAPAPAASGAAYLEEEEGAGATGRGWMETCASGAPVP